ncbi:LacI family DNA-binding transcriptional regulator [uncultured Lacticaseibacillus sp.]|uniref:LacI family DNA-binding transcriptional regulator n=1 Tax=uncultured Lacticaseibacillus sp. TaxID=2775882 RepID=UPI00259699DB|nr:LacI family DNA-binding transcriptional regulator [uncultured Lacticaseibacillus sp.]
MGANNLTIKEIAQMAGVSTSTVSRVLNKQAHVAPDKRIRVQKVLDQSGFQPSAIARGMVSKHTNTFGVVVSDIANPYFTTLVSQIEAPAKAAGYNILLFNTMTAGETPVDASQVEIDAFARLEEKKVDGVLILGGEIDRAEPRPEYLDALTRMAGNLPVVIMAQPLQGHDFQYVSRYQQLSGSIITQHLLASGYHDIGFIGGEPGITITTERLAGYKDAMNTYSTLREDRIFLSNYYVEDGYRSMQKLLASDTRPEAIVAINDQVALGAVRALNDIGLSCPADMAIASCDAFPDSNYFTPRITTINHHNRLLANVAVRKLLHQISPETYDLGDLTILPPELVVRESSGLPSRSNPNE